MRGFFLNVLKKIGGEPKKEQLFIKRITVIPSSVCQLNPLVFEVLCLPPWGSLL